MGDGCVANGLYLVLTAPSGPPSPVHAIEKKRIFHESSCTSLSAGSMVQEAWFLHLQEAWFRKPTPAGRNEIVPEIFLHNPNSSYTCRNYISSMCRKK